MNEPLADLELDVGTSMPAPLFAAHDSAGVATVRSADPQAALRELHEEYAARLLSYSMSILRSREDAEDAVQTTFMNAFGSLQSGQRPRQEASWLFRIARNVCLNRIRTQQRKPAGSLDGIDIASSRSMDDVVEQRLHAVALRNALERLPDQQCKAIVMRELQGATYAEIADALETTQGAVESLIFRARRALAGSLEQLNEGRASHGGLAAAA